MTYHTIRAKLNNGTRHACRKRLVPPTVALCQLEYLHFILTWQTHAHCRWVSRIYIFEGQRSSQIPHHIHEPIGDHRRGSLAAISCGTSLTSPRLTLRAGGQKNEWLDRIDEKCDEYLEEIKIPE